MTLPPTQSVENGPTRGRAVGFWLGLALFVTLLAVPPPSSVKHAAREHFAREIPTDTQKILHARGERSAAPDSEAYRRAEEAAVEARARTMLAAAAVTALVACWWMSVAAPLAVTSLLPIVLLPIVGVLPVTDAALPYANRNVFLFMGGFIIALGVERWGLHRRVALHILRLVGTGRSTIILAFMLASAGLSMWISNTATAMMMLPIGLAVIAALPEVAEGSPDPRRRHFPAALMLGIAYAASIGGVATPIGTPPNIVFRGQFSRLYPAGPEIGFAQWMAALVPFVAIFIAVTWLVLVRVTCPVDRGRLPAARQVIRRELDRLGAMRRPERIMLVVFAVTALLWITRSIPVGGSDYGWAALAERALSRGPAYPGRFRAELIDDATIALGVAIVMFLIPAGRDESGRRQMLMTWEVAQRLPWGILLLFGGGFAIAAGFESSGLSLWCGHALHGLHFAHPVVLVLGTCLLMTFVTEITSNTATAQVMLPIVAKVSQAMGLHPLLLMLPATISASCAFMLPVATPPNAIVFGSGCVPMHRMVRTGVILNLAGVVIVTAVMFLIVCPVLGIDPNIVPDWAR